MSEASVPLEKFRRVCEEYDELEQRLAQALALLERVRNAHIDALSPTTAEDIRAYLKRSEEAR